MKHNNISLILVLGLCISLTLFPSCKRTGVEDPGNLFGPATFSILLDMTAAPNVIFAGDTRETTTISATLKRFDGTPIPNKAVLFDIRNFVGNKANIGFFEGNESVKTKMTDQNGTVSVNYYGPFSNELTNDALVYIYASVAWEGDEFISELAPIYLIRDAVDLTFTLIADPNVLLAAETRPQSQLKAYFKTVDGVPLAGRRIYFKILSGPGSFTNNATKTFVLTDSNGFASITYFGPTKSEIAFDQFVTIQGQPETTSPVYDIYEDVAIRLIKKE